MKQLTSCNAHNCTVSFTTYLQPMLPASSTPLSADTTTPPSQFASQYPVLSSLSSAHTDGVQWLLFTDVRAVLARTYLLQCYGRIPAFRSNRLFSCAGQPLLMKHFGKAATTAAIEDVESLAVASNAFPESTCRVLWMCVMLLCVHS